VSYFCGLCWGAALSIIAKKFFATCTIDRDGDHSWAVVIEQCNLSDPADALVAFTARAIRNAYGEPELRALGEEAASLVIVPEPADSVTAKFGVVNNILAAFRSSLPNPDKEGKKPKHLTNYRSETAEIIAREALGEVFNLVTPYPFTSPALTVQHEELAWRYEGGIPRPVLILWAA